MVRNVNEMERKNEEKRKKLDFKWPRESKGDGMRWGVPVG
jgi:hypothetical protein